MDTRMKRPTNVTNWDEIKDDDLHGSGGLPYKTNLRVGQKVWSWDYPAETGIIVEIGGDYLVVEFKDDNFQRTVGLDDVFPISNKKLRSERSFEVYV